MRTATSTVRTIAASAALVLAGVGVAVATTAAAPVPEIEVVPAVASPLLSQAVAGYEGKWAIEGGSVIQSFEEHGVLVSTGGTPLNGEPAPEEVVSFGFVGGFENLETGAAYAQLSGQAGAGVTAVRVVSASGTVTSAALVDGIWGAVWLAGDDENEYGAATIEFDTAAGTRTVSTTDVDVIAAEQRAADRK